MLQQHRICICKSEPVLEDMTGGIFLQEAFSFSSRFPFSWFILHVACHFWARLLHARNPFSCRHHLTISHDNQHHMKGTSSNMSHFGCPSFYCSFVEVTAKQHLSPAGQPCWTAPAEALGRPLAILPRIFSVCFYLDPLSHLDIYTLKLQ